VPDGMAPPRLAESAPGLNVGSGRGHLVMAAALALAIIVLVAVGDDQRRMWWRRP